ncbi:phosphatase PAP2 family protein [Solirubrobacter taibaiensis]|nr:phosphatase PAP2 family protein [Solirubrobacter taibaiensis]
MPPLLRPASSGPAERLASRVAGWPPAAVFALALSAGFVAFSVVSVLIGTLVTRVVLDVGWVRQTDDGIIDALVAERAPALTDASAVVSGLGGGPVLASLAGLIVVVAAVRRNWTIAVFVAFLLPIETAAYRLTLNLVPRSRPGVARLEDLPLGGSYPSGHTAASIAVYAGLMLLLASATPHRRVVVPAVAVAIAMPILVAVSRMYRGMHHPFDVAGGALVGIGTLAIVVFACRAAEAAARQRQRRRADARIVRPTP